MYDDRQAETQKPSVYIDSTLCWKTKVFNKLYKSHDKVMQDSNSYIPKHFLQ